MIQKAIQKAIMKPSVGTRWLTYFTTLDNKTADFLCKFVADGTIVQRSDERIQKVKKILELKNSIDTQSFKGSLDQFIKQNSKMLDKHQQKVAAQSIQYLDTIKEFTNKQKFSKGVVIYQVEDSKAGMMAVRKIVDLQWGTNSNPWCLISRQDYCDDEEEAMENAWDMWRRYNAYPKHIAFQKGKLLAFCANDSSKKACWWDREDKASQKLKLLDDSQIQIKTVGGTPEEIFQEWLKKHDLIYNQKTGRYDCKEDLYLTDTDIIDGHFPVKFGIINGNFICQDCTSLVSLQGAPTKVKGDISYSGCTNLPNYKQLRLQEFIKQKGLKYNKQTKMYDCEGDLSFSYPCSNEAIKSGKIPIKIGKVNGDFRYSWFDDKASFINFPEEVTGNFEIVGAKNITNLQGSPKKVNGDFEISCCDITSLEGSPEEVGGILVINNNKNLINLKGAPKIIHGNVECYYCDNLTSLQGGPEIIGGQIIIDRCPNLTKKQIQAFRKRVKKK